ncbi:MAG: hypothetical protein H6815_10895 [Phycisphaeraceae bacterium]|nr:hypothetical protein [Phycisphaerales bacterium]MCB9860942.1 hypothetical protein [Phycisphaeraceae bacterium]
MISVARHIAVLCAVVCCFAPTVIAQRERDPLPMREAQPGEERLSQMLAQEIERAEQRAQSLNRAKDMLASGTSSREVLQMLRDSDIQLPLDRVRERFEDRRTENRPMRDPAQGQPLPERRGDHPDDRLLQRPDPREIEWNTVIRDAFMKEHFAEWHDRFSAMQAESPEFAERMMRRMDDKLRDLYAKLQHDPEMGQLDIEEHKVGLSILGIASRVRRATGTDNSTVDLAPFKDELRSLIGKAFDVRTNRNRLNIKRQEERIAAMRNELDTLLSDREKIIDQQVEALMSETGRRRGRGPFEPGMFGGPPQDDDRPGERRRDREPPRERPSDLPLPR